MPAPLRLEVFERPELPDAPAWLLPEQIEDLRLSAYERGYVAGWEDAQRQADVDRLTRQTQIAARIEALSFAYHEARAHVLQGIAPLIEAMLTQLLPATLRAAVIPLTVEQLLPLATRQAEAPLILRIPPGWRADYAAALEGLVLPPLTLTEDPALTEGQAEILGAGPDAAGIRIDLGAVVARVTAALDPYRPHPSPESLRA